MTENYLQTLILKALESYAKGNTDPTLAQEALNEYNASVESRTASDHLELSVNETHVDDFIYDAYFSETKNEQHARFFLHLHLLPAHLQMTFSDYLAQYTLFATYEGKRVRVTGASTMGDVFITSDYEQSSGYQKRVAISDLCEFSSALEYEEQLVPRTMRNGTNDDGPVYQRIDRQPRDYYVFDSPDFEGLRYALKDHGLNLTPTFVRYIDPKTQLSVITSFVKFFFRQPFADCMFVLERHVSGKKIPIAVGYQSADLRLQIDFSLCDIEFNHPALIIFKQLETKFRAKHGHDYRKDS